MALDLGTLTARIRIDRRDLERDLVASEIAMRAAGERMERDADASGRAIGANLGAGTVAGVERGMRDARGRLHDSRAPYVAEGRELGEALGSAIGNGASSGVRDGFGSVVSAAGQVGSSVWNLIPAILALTAVSTIAGPAVAVLGGALASIPALAAGAGISIGALLIGFTGLADRFRKTSSAGGSVVDRAWQIAQAERRVRDANREVTASQDALNRSRQTAVERMEDLNRSVTQASQDERGALLDVADARKALTEAQLSRDPDRIARAQLAYDRAVLSLETIRDRLADLTAEQKRSTKAGVEGSDEVKTALDRQRRALEGVADAEHALTQTRKQSGGGGAAQELTKIAPAAQAAVDAIKSLGPEWEQLRLRVQQKLFGGSGEEIRDLARVWLPMLEDKLLDTAGTLNGIAKTASTSAQQPEFLKNMGTGLDAVDRLVARVGNALAGPFVDAWGRLSAASAPFIDVLGDELGGMVEDFAAWIKSADESGDLERFMDKASGFLKDVFDMGGDVASIIGDIVGAMLGAEDEAGEESTWETLKTTLHELADWFNDPENQRMAQGWFHKLEMAGHTILTVIGWFGDLIEIEGEVERKGGELIASLDRNWDKLTASVSKMPSRISAAAKGMWDGVKNAFRTSMNWIIDAWNRLSFSLPTAKILGQQIGGGSIGVPPMDKMKDGGIVPATPGGRPVVVAEAGKKEAIAPLDELMGMIRDSVREVVGGGNHATSGDITVIAQFGEEQLTPMVVKVIKSRPEDVAKANRLGTKRLGFQS